MITGILKEIKIEENRVSMTPAGVEVLKGHGHTLLVETKAGSGSGFGDDAYAAAGAEIDLVLTLGNRRFAFEMKYSMAPKPTKGFWHAMKDLAIERAWVVAPVEHAYPLADNVEVIALENLPGVIAGAMAP